MRVHFVYPHERVGYTPHAIGWRLADALAARHETYVYDWWEAIRIVPRPGDVLIGHPHPAPMTIMRRSWNDPRWGRRIVLAPYSGSLHSNGFEDRMIRESDCFLAITGRPWAESMKFTHFRSWLPKVRQLDLAVDVSDYPFIKRAFASQGNRRVLYLGHSGAFKDPDYLESIAQALPDVHFGWIGGGEREIVGYERHGVLRCDTHAGRDVVAGYDFLLMAGSNDANPTTILEAMAWGLIPLATATSGYDSRDGVIEIPSADPRGAAQIIGEWLHRPEDDLQELQRENLSRVASRFTWPRLIGAVLEEVDRPGGADVISAPWPDRALMLAGAVSSPFLKSRGMLGPPMKCLIMRKREATRRWWQHRE